MQRRWSLRVVLVVVVLATAAAGCRDDNSPDPAAVKSATAAGEMVGSTLAKVVARLREVLIADPTLTAKQALDRVEGSRASLVPVGDSVDQMLARKGVDLSEMMFRFAEGVASRLPPVAGVMFEPNIRPKYKRDYKGDDRRVIMKGFTNWAVIRAMLVDDGPPRPFRSLFIGENRPPSDLLDPTGNIVVPYVDGQQFEELFGWISDDPIAGTTLLELRGALGF